MIVNFIKKYGINSLYELHLNYVKIVNLGLLDFQILRKNIGVLKIIFNINNIDKN
jgi:hypothetical protein